MKIFDADANPDLSFEISSQYSFIILEVKRNDELYARLKFVADGSAGVLKEIYTNPKSIEGEIKSKIEAEKWPGLETKALTTNSWSPEVLDAITKVDNIAALTTNCTTGDGYHPGNFSKVLLTKDEILLEQINYMNSRSLSHKEDYSLRSFTVSIPLNGIPPQKLKYGQQKLGIMTVEFEDRSSKNNKRCGTLIEAELKKLSE
jgi:hypothetical protein